MSKELNRLILIDKPAGLSSFGVVARVRRKMTQLAREQNWQGKRFKVGHAGTLDPFATGLLLILTGKKTREAQQFSKLDKVYEATLRLGAISSTGDPEGEISQQSERQASQVKIESTLAKFRGEITQTPPIFSAIKINGERAYRLARQGKNPDMPERKVTIFSLELINYSYPELKIRCHVSSGTYIRSLAEDIGQDLGVGAYLTELRRTAIGDFKVDDALSLDDFLGETT